MKLDELLAQQEPPEQIDLSQEDLVRLFWKYRGLLKNQERDQGFWAATNQNLKSAYEKLDEKDRQLVVMLLQDRLEALDLHHPNPIPSRPPAADIECLSTARKDVRIW